MGISDKTVKVCKLTAPILTKYSKPITASLYKNLYKTYPEAKTYFGGKMEEQYKQFNNAIVYYINDIDTLKTLDKETLKQKYRHKQPMHIKPEYCTFIEVSLLQAIKDVFSDAATEELIDAWAEAYDYLGDIVILREETLESSA